MSLYSTTSKLLTLIIQFFKKEGYTDESIKGGIDFAKKNLSKLNLSEKEMNDLKKAMEETTFGKDKNE